MIRLLGERRTHHDRGVSRATKSKQSPSWRSLLVSLQAVWTKRALRARSCSTNGKAAAASLLTLHVTESVHARHISCRCGCPGEVRAEVSEEISRCMYAAMSS